MGEWEVIGEIRITVLGADICMAIHLQSICIRVLAQSSVHMALSTLWRSLTPRGQSDRDQLYTDKGIKQVTGV